MPTPLAVPELSIIDNGHARVKSKRRSYVLHTKERKRMMRQWIKILLLVLVVLTQTACPRNAGQQDSGDSSPSTPTHRY